MGESDWGDLLAPILTGSGLGAEIVSVEPLAGGVSSDIVRVALDDGTVLCAKRALPALKVASHWAAPVERNHYEAEWLRLAGGIVPGGVPRVLAEDRAHGVLVLEYLPPQDYSLWKADLLAGRYDPRVPPLVADMLACIHSATWMDLGVARRFATDAMFDALRLDPYLRTLAQRTPDLAASILAVVEATATTHLALVHGDVSPKNILIARDDGRPVLLDAECAWFGDPAFDAAFCINHLLLKSVHVPAIRDDLMAGAATFFSTWIRGLPATARAMAEARVTSLLPCLLLARIDGKSPVEYLTEDEHGRVRAIARPLIAQPPSSMTELLARLADGNRD